MTAVALYFRHISEAVTSIFEGMTVTFSHLFRKPITIQYPDRIPKPLVQTLPERSRGFLKVDLEICTGCLACMIDCPIDCILIKQERNKETKERFLTQFDIDLAKCMFCGLCTEPCPTGAIHFTKKFEKATYDMSELLYRFVLEGEKVVPYIAPKQEREPEGSPS